MSEEFNAWWSKNHNRIMNIIDRTPICELSDAVRRQFYQAWFDCERSSRERSAANKRRHAA